MRRASALGRLLAACASAVVLAGCGSASSDVHQAGSSRADAKSTECKKSGEGETADRALASCLTADDAGTYAASPSTPADVTVFVDRSASMQGFLDPSYPAHVPTDYRSVIDKVLVGVHPTSAFSFGSQVQPITATLGTLADRGFYGDRDTETESVLQRIARDTAMQHAYVIVTDGRRGSPNSALNQYVALRALARKWVAAGGSLIVGASMAPFSTVAADPSGCRREGESAEDQRCPLYAFALAPKGSQRWLTGVLASAFEHLYTWPAMRLAGREEALISPKVQSSLQFERNWGPTGQGSPIVRSRGSSASNDWSSLRLTPADSTSAEGAGVLAALRGQRMTVVVSTRRFGDGPKSDWNRVSGNTTILRPNPNDVMAVDLVTRGQGAQPTLYRVDLMPEGSPAWLDQFDATNRDDRMRTYGLGRLFEAFRQDAKSLSPESATLARFFVLAN
jgi:hypothetical protein